MDGQLDQAGRRLASDLAAGEQGAPIRTSEGCPGVDGAAVQPEGVGDLSDGRNRWERAGLDVQQLTQGTFRDLPALGAQDGVRERTRRGCEQTPEGFFRP